MGTCRAMSQVHFQTLYWEKACMKICANNIRLRDRDTSSIDKMVLEN